MRGITTLGNGRCVSRYDAKHIQLNNDATHGASNVRIDDAGAIDGDATHNATRVKRASCSTRREMTRYTSKSMRNGRRLRVGTCKRQIAIKHRGEKREVTALKRQSGRWKKWEPRMIVLSDEKI